MTKFYRDMMIDIETLGTSQPPAITRFSAVFFDIDAPPSGVLTGIELPVLDCYLDVVQAVKQGMQMNLSTIRFWAEQEKMVPSCLPPKEVKVYELHSFCLALQHFMSSNDYRSENIGIENAKVPTIRLWSRGLDFDLAALKYIWEHNMAGIPCPVKYDAGRDLRTLLDFVYGTTKPSGLMKKVKEYFTKHDSVDDCYAQIFMAQTAWGYTQRQQMEE